MPELPEVELVARSLASLIKNRRIAGAELLRQKLAPSHTPDEFNELLAGAEIKDVTRRGKNILFDLSNAQTLLVHLRMSGRFMILPPERELPKYTHAVFYLTDDSRLIFQDQRHFGLMRIFPSAELSTQKDIAKLAPEPFSDEFSSAYLRRVLAASNKPLKEFLLDQTKVCGVGNIYACEAMFLAKINPQTRARDVSARRAAALHQMIRQVLGESIAQGSTLNVDPENIDGSYYGGGYEGVWRVYDRENSECPQCQTPIARLKQAGRSTYFCPKCQK